MHETITPSAETITRALKDASVLKPDGTPYAFVSNTTALKTSTIRSKCLTFYTQGGATVESVPHIITNLKAAALQAQPGER